jgi:hypothetical protein
MRSLSRYNAEGLIGHGVVRKVTKSCSKRGLGVVDSQPKSAAAEETYIDRCFLNDDNALWQILAGFKSIVHLSALKMLLTPNGHLYKIKSLPLSTHKQ